MKRRAPAIGPEALAAEIASLPKLDIDELRQLNRATSVAQEARTEPRSDAVGLRGCSAT
jgi:hypothetical protein